MKRKNLIERLDKENELLGPPFDPRFQQDHKALADFDIYEAKKEFSNRQNLTSQTLSNLDIVLETGLSKVAKYKSHQKDFTVANEYCDTVLSLVDDYAGMLNASVREAEEKSSECESKLSHYFKLRDEKNLLQERSAWNKALDLYCAAHELGRKKGISVGNSKKVENLLKQKDVHAELETQLDEIKQALTDVSWNAAGKERVEKTQKKYFGGIIKAGIAKKCKNNNFYEAVWKSEEYKKEFDYLTKNWDELAQASRRLTADARTLVSILNTLNRSNLTPSFFKQLKERKFNSYDEFKTRPYFCKIVESYNEARSALSGKAGEKALDVAQRLCTENGDEIKTAVKSKDTSELEKYRKLISGLMDDMNVLAGFADVSKYWSFLENNYAAISSRIDSLNRETQRAHEKKVARIQANDELRRAKNEFNKQKNAFQKKEKEQQKKIQSYVRENQVLTCSLADVQKSDQEKKETIDSLMQNLAKMSNVIRESTQGVKDELHKKFSSEIMRVEGAINSYEKNNAELLKKVDGFYSAMLKAHKQIDGLKTTMSQGTDIDEERLAQLIKKHLPDNSGIKNELSGLRTQVNGIKKKVDNLSFLQPSDFEGRVSGLYESLESINDKISRIEQKKPEYIEPIREIQEQVEQVLEVLSEKPKQAPSAQPAIYIGTMNNIGTINVGQQKKEEMFDLVKTINKMPHPTDENLCCVRERIVGNERSGMASKIKSLKEYFTPNAPLLRGRFNLEWLKELRDHLLKEINFGMIGHHADENGLSRDPFYELIYNAINPYISQCEQTLAN